LRKKRLSTDGVKARLHIWVAAKMSIYRLYSNLSPDPKLADRKKDMFSYYDPGEFAGSQLRVSSHLRLQ